MNQQTDIEYWTNKFQTDAVDKARAIEINLSTNADMELCLEAARNIRLMEASSGIVAPFNHTDIQRIDDALEFNPPTSEIKISKLWLVHFLRAWLSVGKIVDQDNA